MQQISKSDRPASDDQTDQHFKKIKHQIETGELNISPGVRGALLDLIFICYTSKNQYEIEKKLRDFNWQHVDEFI